MASNNRVHQLSSGLYVSGAPDQYKERTPTMTSTAMPYTGGDIKKSGELGKMFDISVETPKSKRSGPLTGSSAATPSGSASTRAGSFRATAASNSGPLVNPPPPQITHLGSFSRPTSNSGPLSKNEPTHAHRSGSKNSGPLSRQNSGPLAANLPATGLITSGPVSSGPASRNHSGPIESNSFPRNPSTQQANKNPANQAINHLSPVRSHSVLKNLPRVILWTVVPLFIIGFIAGGFILGAVQNAVLLITVVCLFGALALILIWNSYMGRNAAIQFVSKFPDIGLSDAKDGQYVKITGIVTCGSVPLESSYQKVSRCVYTACGLYEYRSLKARPAKEKHMIFTWGLRYTECRVADFYISDYKSGLRALVKAGYGASVTPFVEENTIVDVTKKDREMSPNFLRWLSEHNLSSDDRIMRLKEGFIKEGNLVTVMGVVQRTDNVLMIVPPSDTISTGCQWTSLFLPAPLPGIVLLCEDNSKDDVIPV
ncbi:hypothetical protein KP509_10G017500 [Ceratopteris richardii]|uniref:Ubiquitin-specific protease family C19-related protein n=1 Tax=Ceratopteris richardii TaxID=49495 RepID=A0A8T2TTR7_CERRI|nr:hypothetical protein KP509_10G017500 [Ceratopteris richardii]KAH7426805.1 hypothetical protein KP509_10G017500 [Ceratopteris richardii]KAH7426806.1 hypothetical protein KP509_10G017500 [Ceratopteris richardii]KAH7426807.1 hypothetical protein KP509_10G017500 [Ceratopteris richardii]